MPSSSAGPAVTLVPHPESMPSKVTLRQATAADAGFACGVVDRTIRIYAEQTFESWPVAEAHARTTGDAAAGRLQIMELDGQSIGIMKVERIDTHIQLHQLFILPEYQRRGIGSELLENLLAEGRASGLPVRLRVLRVNPAKRLYERHGFRVTSEEPERFYMECAP